MVAVYFVTTDRVVYCRVLPVEKAQEMHEAIKEKYKDVKPRDRGPMKIEFTNTDGTREIFYIKDMWVDYCDVRVKRKRISYNHQTI